MINGNQLIGSNEVWAKGGEYRAFDPSTGEARDGRFSCATDAELDQACALAAAAFPSYRESALERRAAFLEQIAANIIALDSLLIETAAGESGLPLARLNGERDRTVNQLRMFATLVRSGVWQDVTIDGALPDRQPLPRPDLRRRNIGVGPVAVFGASNFPLAFSVAGGDTASALAAGCPVVVKAHPAHPGTSELVGRAIQKAVAQSGLHEGVFSLLTGNSIELGAKLVADPRIKAVGFTGSRSGGMALMRIAASRACPIPVFAEMSSINPVILMPSALDARAAAIAGNFVTALTMGAGQFCTNPGLVFAVAGPGLDAFEEAAYAALVKAPASTMLTQGIHQSYLAKIEAMSASGEAQRNARGLAATGSNQCQASLTSIDSAKFRRNPVWHEEVFGASSLIVRCTDQADLCDAVASLEGQLTATIHMDEGDLNLAQALLPLLEDKAGRVIVNAFPTGVEVCAAMVHGGPFPATSDVRSTSVGTLAINRFLRPVCYQGLPMGLLPEALRK